MELWNVLMKNYLKKDGKEVIDVRFFLKQNESNRTEYIKKYLPILKKDTDRILNLNCIQIISTHSLGKNDKKLLYNVLTFKETYGLACIDSLHLKLAFSVNAKTLITRDNDFTHVNSKDINILNYI